MDSNAIPDATRERRERSGKKIVRRTVLVGLVLFVCGMVIGGGGIVLYFQRQALAESPTPERIGGMLLASLADEFSLTADETAAIRGQVREKTEAMALSSQAYGDSVRRQFGELCGEICNVLGPNRAKKWREVMRRKFGENASAYIHMTECHDGDRHGDDCACLLAETEP